MFKMEKFEPGQEAAELHAGDMVKHPFRDSIVPIEFIGDEVVTFVPRAYAKEFTASRARTPGLYEAIAGSEQFRSLEKDGRFVQVRTRREPSAEIDLTSDLERRTLVVPLSELKKAA